METELILLATNEKELAGFIDFFFKPFLKRESISNSVKNELNILDYLRGRGVHGND